MITYKLLPDYCDKPASCIMRSDGVCIPFDPANTDYQQYLLWLEQGNTPTAADAATVTADTPATGA